MKLVVILLLVVSQRAIAQDYRMAYELTNTYSSPVIFSEKKTEYVYSRPLPSVKFALGYTKPFVSSGISIRFSVENNPFQIGYKYPVTDVYEPKLIVGEQQVIESATSTTIFSISEINRSVKNAQLFNSRK